MYFTKQFHLIGHEDFLQFFFWSAVYGALIGAVFAAMIRAAYVFFIVHKDSAL